MPQTHDSLVGRRYDVEVGPVAHGGHFVARVATGLDEREMVVFVRHALPGEQVTVEITEDRAKFLRADAVAVAAPSPQRVRTPCPLAHPGGCGGCDFQHVELSEQRRLKATVVAEQLARLAGLERDVVVEPVPGDANGLFWRTRMQYVHLPGGDRGLRKHRSHEVVLVDQCLIAHPDARGPGDPTPLVERVETTAHGAHEFTVAGDGFWQVHPGAPRALVDTVMGMLDPAAGEHALDLYAGVGLFSAFLAQAVGPRGSVTAVESDRPATKLAKSNLTKYAQASVVCDRVDRALSRFAKGGGPKSAGLVVLDPPRAGAKRQVVRAIVQQAPRSVAYVACDPASLARDISYFADAGYRLADLRAFDLFPMTSHVEVVAKLVRADADLR